VSKVTGTADGVVDHHRAEYILERGTWSATCKGCGWRTADPSRRGAAALFRRHYRNVADTTEANGSSVESLDEGKVHLDDVTVGAADPKAALSTSTSG
jgi:hypothetical protein